VGRVSEVSETPLEAKSQNDYAIIPVRQL